MLPKTQATLLKIIPYAVVWTAAAVVYLLLEKGILGDSEFYPTTNIKYTFGNVLLVILPAAFIGGIVMGLIEVLVVKPTFQKLPFGSKIIIKAFVYLLIMMSVLFSVSFINNSLNLQKKLWEPEVIHSVGVFFRSFAFWSVMIYGVFITVFVQFFTEVSDSLGINQLKNFFIGTYHKPKEEERVFMFLDLKGSTAMAERLGHSLYFQLIRKFFADISDPIVNSWGEIYQYVGDEVVVSWPKKLGLKDSNCIKCFFQCRELVAANSEYYKVKFGIIPEFKAGIHIGKVAIGEIGVSKRDILFSGDVLNTTSRIQSMCNELGVDNLISQVLYDALDVAGTEFFAKEMCVCQLRGKNEEVKLLHLDITT